MVSERFWSLDLARVEKNRKKEKEKTHPQREKKRRRSSAALIPLDPIRIGKPRDWTKNTPLAGQSKDSEKEKKKKEKP